MNIGSRLRTAREAKKLTAKELSSKSGVPEKTIYRIETGEVTDPKISSLLPLISALNCTCDEILLGNQETNKFQRYLSKAVKLPPRDQAIIMDIIHRYSYMADMHSSMEEYKQAREYLEPDDLGIEEFETHKGNLEAWASDQESKR